MSSNPEDPFEIPRRRMVEEQLRRRGIRDLRVLEAMRKVPRNLFVPEEYRTQSCDDRPLPIGSGQTISQPYIVALMTDRLKVQPGSKVLEVGTGSGYQAAVLAEMGASVYSIERIPELAEAARQRIETLGIGRIRIRQGDGSLGWPEEAPFTGILVAACAREAPENLRKQLAEGGRMVIPVGGSFDQKLTLVEHRQGEWRREEICGCLFVPLL